jgi:endo-1,4-beta-xylanase
MTLALLAGCGQQVSNEAGTDASVAPAAEATAEGVTEEAADAATEAAEEVAQEKLTDDAILKDLCKDYFTLGVGINGSMPQNNTINIPQYKEMSLKHFNSCTMTNLMKSGYILDQMGCQSSEDGMPVLNFMSIDPTLEWCQETGMKMRGHTLVWHTQTPDWFFRVDYSDNGDYVDRDTMLARMESYIKQMLTHVQENYPGVIYCWDVVNEAVDPESADPESYFKCRTKIEGADNPWYATVGQDYVEMAFTYARKYADPDVKLFYNDYNTFQVPKTEGIYALCSKLNEKGLIDGIGMQGYWGISYPQISEIKTAMTKFAELGLEIQVTELSVGVDEENDVWFEKQAKKYGEIFEMIYEMDSDNGGPANITNVTLFGLVDHYREGDTTNTRIFDQNYEPKPSYFAIAEVMEKYAK